MSRPRRFSAHRLQQQVCPASPNAATWPLPAPTDARVDRPFAARSNPPKGSIFGPLRPAFAHLVDLSAKGRGRAHASAMCQQIQRVLDQGGWTDSESAQLRTALGTWQRRADGQDARYLLIGTNRRGRLRRADEQDVRALQALMDIEVASKALVEGIR